MSKRKRKNVRRESKGKPIIVEFDAFGILELFVLFVSSKMATSLVA